jgi:nitric oxide dioxygenase
MAEPATAAALLFDLLSPDDHPRIRATLAPAAADPGAFARAFYVRLFELAPGVRTLFPADLSRQEMKLAQTLVAVVGGLDRSDGLLPTLHALGRAHRGYGAKAAHYGAVGRALLDTLAAANGEAFDADARASWERLYAWVAQHMVQGAAAR